MFAEPDPASTRSRLLCVSHYFESHRGGIEMVAGRLARELEQRDFDVTWAACDASESPDDITGLPLRASNLVERLAGLPFPLPGPKSIVRLIAAVRRSDAVLVHDGMYATSIVAILAARSFGRPVLLVQHIGHVPATSVALRILFWIADRLLTRPMLRLANEVAFISATSAKHFADVKTRSVPLLIFNGVDTDTFHPSVSDQERDQERQSLGWPADRKVVLFVGRFLEKKGLLRLREMCRLRPNIHWAFAGWGPCDPDDWGLANVSVHRGLSGADLASLYRAADVLALPSKSEGFPLVVQEALACGLHPVCCDDGAKADPAAADYISSIANDGDEAKIIDQYLRSIDKSVATPDTEEARSSRARFARQRYAWTATSGRYSAAIRSMMPIARSRERLVA